MDPCRAVSVRANRNYIKALKVIASERGIQIGDLVREALDTTLGETIQNKSLFFDKDDYQNSHSVESASIKHGAA